MRIMHLHECAVPTHKMNAAETIKFRKFDLKLKVKNISDVAEHIEYIPLQTFTKCMVVCPTVLE